MKFLSVFFANSIFISTFAVYYLTNTLYNETNLFIFGLPDGPDSERFCGPAGRNGAARERDRRERRACRFRHRAPDQRGGRAGRRHHRRRRRPLRTQGPARHLHAHRLPGRLQGRLAAGRAEPGPAGTPPCPPGRGQAAARRSHRAGRDAQDQAHRRRPRHLRARLRTGERGHCA